MYEVLVNLSILKPLHDYIITLAMSVFIFVSSYFAFWQPAIFEGKPMEEVIPFLKKKKSKIEEVFAEALKKNLLLLLEEEKLFLNPDLRLEDVAHSLKVQRNVMSQFINQHFGMNFNQFINAYRIKEAEQLLLIQGKELSIKEIIYRSGFNNRTTFFKYFKLKHKMTPLQYRQARSKELINSQ